MIFLSRLVDQMVLKTSFLQNIKFEKGKMLLYQPLSTIYIHIILLYRVMITNITQIALVSHD